MCEPSNVNNGSGLEFFHPLNLHEPESEFGERVKEKEGGKWAGSEVAGSYLRV